MRPILGHVQGVRISSSVSTVTVVFVVSLGKFFFHFKNSFLDYFLLVGVYRCSILSFYWFILIDILNLYRTQEIVDGLRAVQRTVAYDRDGKTGNTTKVCASRAEPMDMNDEVDMDELIQSIDNDQGQFLDNIETTQARPIDQEERDEPDTEYLLENNVRRNFGNDFNTSSAKWMMNSAMSQRQY